MTATPTPQPRVTVCLMDTGILPRSVAEGRVVGGVNLTKEGDADDIFAYRNDHGTRVAETILAECPGTELVVLRVMDENGWLCTMEAVEAAFAWVLENVNNLGPAVVCAAFGDMFHYRSDEMFRETALRGMIHRLRTAGVLTVTAAGNMYTRFQFSQPQGMAWPAILRQTVSVGALIVTATDGKLQTDPSSQRLHSSFGTGCSTSLFAVPGAPGDTSGAVARVTGRLAKVLQDDSSASADALLERLMAQTRPVRDIITGLTWPSLL